MTYRSFCGIWSASFMLLVAEVIASDLPIREITVFKDGHAMVVHEGEAETQPDGSVELNYVPQPVIGTFWLHSADDQAELISVAARETDVTKTRSALQTQELFKANPGVEVRLYDVNRKEHYTGVIQEMDPQATVVTLKSGDEYRVLPIASLQDVTFLSKLNTDFKYSEKQRQLKLKLAWKQNAHPPKARIGMSYLQKGIRWIPNYRLTLLDGGEVRVQLQATLLNELADLKDVTTHLLIGVPSFDFKDTIDPMALQAQMTELSAYFTNNSVQSPYASNFSNSIMLQSQVSRMGDYRRPAENAAVGDVLNLGPEIAGSGANEDLFVFTVKNITLAKGERMIVSVGDWKMKYEDVYKLELPAVPPQEVRQQLNSEQQRQIADLHNAPKVKHVIRIINSSKMPLTTAPALFASKSSVLGQGMMTYTSPGSRVDVTLTTAINVSVLHDEEEVSRTMKREEDGQNYLRVDLSGRVTLSNQQGETIKLEVVRETMGAVDSAGNEGAVTQPGKWLSRQQPEWWAWYSWPTWWHNWNSRGRVAWNFELPSGKQIVLPYQWHYIWRN